jgi:hypothetical protein
MSAFGGKADMIGPDTAERLILDEDLLAFLRGLPLLALLDRVVTQKGMNAAYPIDHLSYAQVHN